VTSPTAAERFEAVLDGLADPTVADDEVVVSGAQVPDDERQATFLVYVGIVDLLAEAALNALDEDDRGRLLGRAQTTLSSVDGPMRFARYERGSTAEQQELVSRMRGKDIAVTSEWLVPRLRSDIGSYRRRIDALRRAIDGSG
jgi:hypothetical protein